MSFKFREHRGSLDESMKTVVELPDRAALLAHINTFLEPWGEKVEDSQLQVTKHCYDSRIEWDTHIVTGPNGVLGFTNGPV